jgi:glycosyltransferase involved in cell wall biosynthesis
VTINVISPHASHYLGGMEVVTIEMARYLSRNGVSVRFFTRKVTKKSDLFRQLLKEASSTLTIQEVTLPASTPLPDGTWPKFYQISNDFGLAAKPLYKIHSGADLFVTHLSIDSLFVPDGSTCVLHLHGSPVKTDPRMDSAVKIPELTIAHSRSISEWWCSQYPFLNPSIFQNGIDTKVFYGNPFSNRPIDVLYVGRFMEHKGIDTILNSATDSMNIAIAGNGLYLNKLKEIAKRRGLVGSVAFFDTPSSKFIKQLYKRSKIFACPSQGREGVLTTLLEAAASGCSIVTASGSGMTDIVKNQQNGTVIMPGDIAALSGALKTLLSDTGRRIELAVNIQSEVQSYWSWKSKIVQLKELYNEAL